MVWMRPVPSIHSVLCATLIPQTWGAVCWGLGAGGGKYVTPLATWGADPFPSLGCQWPSSPQPSPAQGGTLLGPEGQGEADPMDGSQGRGELVRLLP